MKHLFKTYGIVTIVLSIMVLFSACSKTNYTSLLSNKMDHRQTPVKVITAPPSHNNATADAGNNPVKGTIAENVQPVPTPSVFAQNEPVAKIHRNHKTIKTIVQDVKMKTGAFIGKQTASLNSLKSHQNITSVNQLQGRGSWLGLAIVCLVVGLVLAFLGFGSLGALFWTIGIIILVIALVFFVLWLLAEAVES